MIAAEAAIKLAQTVAKLNAVADALAVCAEGIMEIQEQRKTEERWAQQ